MKRRARYFQLLILVAVCAALQACAQGEDYLAPKHAPNEMIKQASAFAASSGIAIENYSVGSVSFDYTKKKWQVVYEARSLGVGDHFAIVIDDDRVEKVELIRGL